MDKIEEEHKFLKSRIKMKRKFEGKEVSEDIEENE